jgi:hypothetical protein
VPSTVATPTSGLGTPEPTPAIQAPIIDPCIAIPSMPCSASGEDLKSQLETKEVVIAGLQDDIQKLLLETKENRLLIAKQVQEIEELRRQCSHASTVYGIQNPTDDETHAHDTNMLVDNDVIENVVATVIYGVLEDIHSPIRRRPSIPLPPPSHTVQSLNTEGTQDSLSFPLISTANDVHVPSEPPSEVPDLPCQNEIIQLRGNNKLLREHLSELSEQYYQWKVACILTMDKPENGNQDGQDQQGVISNTI